MKKRDLTQHEIIALQNEYNLADAHTHQSQSPTQKAIVANLDSLWYESEQKKQHEIEEKFLNVFFQFHKQTTALTTPSMLVYASSIAMVMAANYFAKKNLSVALLTPCFDNLADIMKNLDVPLEPLYEEWLHDPEKLYHNLEENITSDVICIVTPNNPTGWELTGTQGENYKKGFEELIRYAKDNDKILSFDFCFASTILHTEDVPRFDVYELLEDSGVKYISYEDTGKTWPLQDAKVAILKCSADIYPELRDIQTSYLLNVSPFILNVVTQYITDSIHDNGNSIVNLIEANRAVAREYTEGTILEMQDAAVPISVGWFKITDARWTATELQKAIYELSGVYVLPGTYFFWDDHNRGENYIRVALARDTDLFTTAMLQLQKGLKQLMNENYE